MVLSKRERYIVFAAAATLGLLALDRIIYTPLMERWSDIDKRTATARKELIDANKLIKESRQKSRAWADLGGKRLPGNASEAESQILGSVRDWASESRLSLSSLKPERNEKERDFYRITFRATGSGTMSQVSRFLYLLETASVPARLTDVTLTSRKEGTDDLTINLGVATIYPIPESEKPRPAVQTAAIGSLEVMR